MERHVQQWPRREWQRRWADLADDLRLPQPMQSWLRGGKRAAQTRLRSSEHFVLTSTWLDTATSISLYISIGWLLFPSAMQTHKQITQRQQVTWIPQGPIFPNQRSVQSHCKDKSEILSQRIQAALLEEAPIALALYSSSFTMRKSGDVLVLYMKQRHGGAG